jgi:hypothetical protein
VFKIMQHFCILGRNMAVPCQATASAMETVLVLGHPREIAVSLAPVLKLSIVLFLMTLLSVVGCDNLIRNSIDRSGFKCSVSPRVNFVHAHTWYNCYLKRSSNLWDPLPYRMDDILSFHYLFSLIFLSHPYIESTSTICICTIG